MMFEDLLVSQAKARPRFAEFLARVARRAAPEKVIALNYAIDARPRWSAGTPHSGLYEIIDLHRHTYRAHLSAFAQLTDWLIKIPAHAGDTSHASQPHWINGWLPGLDGVTLYGFLAREKPRRYVEVGSGNSTKFARRAISDHALPTSIISIDPCPRAEIDELCDQVIRRPLETVPLDLFDALEPNDILLVDSSHRVFMNSDVTAVFLDVLPRLKPGVLVAIHDVTLPYDYPAGWSDRYYSEQYLLAAYLLARGQWLDIELANAFVSDDPELRAVLSPLWSRRELAGVEKHGGLFWLRTRDDRPNAGTASSHLTRSIAPT